VVGQIEWLSRRVIGGMDWRYLQGTPMTVHRRLMLLNLTLDKLRAVDADESISRSDIESLESHIAARMTDAVADGHKLDFRRLCCPKDRGAHVLFRAPHEPVRPASPR
jgi:hypothetical protein